MKHFLLSLMTLAFLGSPVHAVELHDASNQQLVEELARRLGSNGAADPNGCLVNYFCDPYNALEVTVYDPNGIVRSQKFYPGNAKDCADQAAFLNVHRSHLNGRAVVALCDPSTMHRLVITAEGMIRNDVQSSLPMADCLAQARLMNGN